LIQLAIDHSQQVYPAINLWSVEIKHTAIDVYDARITSEISSIDTTTNTVLAAGHAASGSGDIPSNDITLSPEQKHVLDLVQAGKK